MKLFRFVGEQECKKLLWNETIENDFDWSTKYDTNSKGICFFANNRTQDIEKIANTALDDWGFEGIVKTFALVEIEVETARKAWGFYSGGMRTEYNLTEYSIKDIKAIYKLDKRTSWEENEKNWYSYSVKKVHG